MGSDPENGQLPESKSDEPFRSESSPFPFSNKNDKEKGICPERMNENRTRKHDLIGSSAEDCASAPSHTTVRAGFSHTAVDRSGVLHGCRKIRWH